MEPIQLVSLFGIMLAMAALPSSSVAFVVARTLTHGPRQGALAAAGIAAGDVVLVGLVLSGLAAAAEVLGDHFVIVRYVAGLYLVLLGLSLLRRGGRSPATLPGPRASLGSFVVGLVMTLGDLKALFFYAALFPALVDVPGLALTEALAIAALTGLAVGGIKLGYVHLAHRFSGSARPGGNGMAFKVAGGVSLGAGVVVLVRN